MWNDIRVGLRRGQLVLALALLSYFAHTMIAAPILAQLVDSESAATRVFAIVAVDLIGAVIVAALAFGGGLLIEAGIGFPIAIVVTRCVLEVLVTIFLPAGSGTYGGVVIAIRLTIALIATFGAVFAFRAGGRLGKRSETGKVP